VKINLDGEVVERAPDTAPNRVTTLSLPGPIAAITAVALGTTEGHRGLDAEELKVNERGKALCLRDAGSARQLLGDLFRSNLNPLGEETLAGLVSALDPETARRVTADQPPLGYEFRVA
jgi:hypothetical protein